MKITKQSLKKLIKEEIENLTNEGVQMGVRVKGSLRAPNIYDAIKVMLAYAEGRPLPENLQATVASVVDDIYRIMGKEEKATNHKRLFLQKQK